MKQPKNRGRRARGAAGFTLVEVMLTVAILSSLAMGSLLVMVPIAKQSRLSKEVEFATMEARSVLEKVQATPFAQILTEYPDGANLPVAALKDGNVAVSYVDTSADPLFMNVTISWTGSDLNAYSRSFVTVRTE